MKKILLISLMLVILFLIQTSQTNGAIIEGTNYVTMGRGDIIRIPDNEIHLVKINHLSSVDKLLKNIHFYDDLEAQKDDLASLKESEVLLKQLHITMYNDLLAYDFFVWDGQAKFGNLEVENKANEIKNRLKYFNYDNLDKEFFTLLIKYSGFVEPVNPLSPSTEGRKLTFSSGAIKTVNTTIDGNFRFEDVKEGNYLLHTTWKNNFNEMEWYVPVVVTEDKTYQKELKNSNGIKIK